jgi:outer membrane protein
LKKRVIKNGLSKLKYKKAEMIKIRYICFLLILVALLVGSQEAKSQSELLTLSNAIERALKNNYNLLVSERDLQIATINNNWGTAGRYPRVTFDVTSSNSRDFNLNTSNRLVAGVGLSWVLFDGFRVHITKDQLELLEGLSQGYIAVDIENTIQDVILAYYNIIIQRERLEVYRNLMQLSQDKYDYEQKRYEIGSAVTYNLLLAKNVFLADKTQYLRQEVEVRNAIRSLNFLMGEDNGDLWRIEEQLDPDTSSYVLSDLREKMVSNNRVLRNQYINVMIRQKQTELRRSELQPTIRLSTGIQDSYNRSVLEGGDPRSSHSLSPYGNISLSYDIFNGGNKRRAIEISRINEEIAGIEISRIEHRLNNELLVLYDNYNVRLELLGLANERLESTQLNLRIADEKFKAGTINSFNYRDIQLMYLDAALDRLSAINNLIASHTYLTRITGGFMGTTE